MATLLSPLVYPLVKTQILHLLPTSILNSSSRTPAHSESLICPPTRNSTASMSSFINATPEEWRKELECLPTLEETKGLIPSIFLAHGQPLLIYPDSMDISSSRMSSVADVQGPKGSLATFLRDLGPALLEKYRPKAVVVLSAHWETSGEILVSDYGVENPLLYDCESPGILFEVKQ